MAQATELTPEVVPTTSAVLPRGKPPVKWLSVRQLLHTAVEVMQASMFARFADKREAMASCPREVYRLFPVGEAPATVRVDFVSDTGDGFDATFATAHCVASAPEVGEKGNARPADLLVLGGDEVYPVASVVNYRERLNQVFGQAAELAGMEGRPPVVALPGNHDWYDGLTAFRRNFCESWVLHNRSVDPAAAKAVVDLPAESERDEVGGWGAFQSRSYFAIQLSPDWWLWGVDSQLNAAVDAEQLAYFNEARAHLGDANIILCTATPSWLEAEKGHLDEGAEPYCAKVETPLFTMLWFIDRVLGPADRERVRLVLTGDKHHYARYQPAEESAPTLVTCGGGGAFLSSTHHLKKHLWASWRPWAGEEPNTKYTRTTEYPTQNDSRAQIAGLRFLRAAWLNGVGLPVLAGVANFLLFLALVVHSPLWITVAAFVVVGLLVPYAASGIKGHRPGWRRLVAVLLLALLHTALHLIPATLAAWLLFDWRAGGHDWYLWAGTIVGLTIAATAAFVTYLRLADLFGYHTLEAFSGLRIESYKSHLRLMVTATEVRVHVIGIDDVPKSSKAKTPDDLKPRAKLVDDFPVYPRPS